MYRHKKDESIHIIKKEKDHYVSHDGTLNDSLNMFIDINNEVEHKVEDLATATESAISRIEYKIKHKPLTLMSLTLSYELILNLFFFISSIGVAYF